MTQTERITQLLQLMKDSELSMEKNFDICHYTDADGLFGILSTKSLRLTNKYFLNDINEPYYWKNVIDDSIKRNRDEWIEKIPNYDEIVLSFLKKENDFIFSLSTEIDSIHQWNYYGNGFGYAIVFDKNELTSKLHSPGVDCSIGIVDYNSEKQKAIIDFLINVYMRLIIESYANPAIDTRDILEKINWFTSYYKQSNHQIEKEIRIVIRTKEENVQFRIKNGIIT